VAATATTEPEPAPEAPLGEPETATQPDTPAKGRSGRGLRVPGIGRRGKRRPAPAAAAPVEDSHLDWVKTLRAEETPARVGGDSTARHAKDAEPPEPGEDEL
jgi:hypothetical protein